MNLKDFIKETIAGIVEATEELQKTYESRGVIVNPPVSDNGQDLYRQDDESHTYRRVESVEFDVAVSAASDLAGGGTAGLKVLSFEARVDGSAARRHEEVSRVRFAIPLVLSPSSAESANRQTADEKDRDNQEALAKLNQPQVRAGKSWMR